MNQMVNILSRAVQKQKLYQLGMRPAGRASLAQVNEQQPVSLYETVFHRILRRCRDYAPKHRFKFIEKLYLVDVTTVDLCLLLFSRTTFRKTKGAIKLYIGPNAAPITGRYI